MKKILILLVLLLALTGCGNEATKPNLTTEKIVHMTRVAEMSSTLKAQWPEHTQAQLTEYWSWADTLEAFNTPTPYPTYTPYPTPTQYPQPDECNQEKIILPCSWIVDESKDESWESIAVDVYDDSSYAIHILNWNRDENGFPPITIKKLYIPSMIELLFNYKWFGLPMFPTYLNYAYPFGYYFCHGMETPRPCLIYEGKVTWEWISEWYEVPVWALKATNLTHDGVKFITLTEEELSLNMIMIPKVKE